MGAAPFLWKKDTGVMGIPGSPYNPRTVADAGALVAGLAAEPFPAQYSSGYWLAATGVWTSMGGYQGMIGCPGYGEAYTVSADGFRIGGELFTGCNLRPYTWTRVDGYNVLPTTGSAGQVSTLSGDGLWAGGWDTHPTLGYRRPALWDSSSVETFPLETPPDFDGGGEISAMNNDGSIFAGISDDLGAFVHRDGVLTQIAVPNNNSIPTGLSDDGTLVVGSWGSPFTGKTPWIWTESGGAMEANQFFVGQGVSLPAGVELTEMMGVSRDGLTFLAVYENTGPQPGGAVIIELPAPGWTDLGLAKQGSSGDPLLIGEGSLSGGSLNGLDLSNAQPVSTASLIFGFSQIDAPFKGGTLVPSPFLIVPLATSGAGALALPFTMPSGAPAGTELFFQYWIQDPGATLGLSASNGLKGTTP
jgi:hypothetical protein